MALSQSKLADELVAMSPTDDEAVAIQNLVTAYGNYAADAEALSPILPAAVVAGKAAMAAALVGMSAPGAGLTKVPTATVAFWAAVAALGPLAFAGATAVTPPPHATFAARFADKIAYNLANTLPLDEAAQQLAEPWHQGATVGGTVTTPGPTVTPIH